MKSGRNDSTDSEDIRVKKLQTATVVFKAARVVFALGGAGFALAAIVVAVGQAPAVGIPAAIGMAGVGSLFGLVFAAGMWFGVGWFLRMARDQSTKMFGPQFEQDLTGKTDYWDQAAAQVPTSSAVEPSTPQLDLDVDLTASIVVSDIEESLTFTAAHLFTQDDLRGNVDLIVAASPGDTPDHLTDALLQHLQLGFDDRQTQLKALGYQPNDPDGTFLVVLCYSVTDLIGELDRPRLEQWIDESAVEAGAVGVYWDDRLLGTVRLVVAD